MGQKSRSLMWAEYIPATVAIQAISLLPIRVASFCGGYVGLMLYRILPRYRNIALRNLEIAFGSKYSLQERKILAKEAFMNFGRSIFELVCSTRLTPEKLIAQTQCKTPENFEALLSAKEGIVACGAHQGSFFWPVLYGAALGAKIHLVIRPLDNPLLQKHLIRMLMRWNISIIPTGRAVTLGRKALLRGEIVAIAIDQEAEDGGLFIPFLGMDAATQRGASVLARWSQSRVAYVSHLREGGQHLVSATRPFSLPISDRTAGRHGDSENMLLLHSYIEHTIRGHPESYLWLHPRWSIRPPGEANLY